jgi:parvulin-like peptidyl-prolyl isomerase
MSKKITVSQTDIIQQIKRSCQIPTVIENILTRKIIESKAEEQGIQVETSELQQAAESWRLKNNLLSANATWFWLQKHSLSLDDFEELIYDTVIYSKLAQHLFAEKVEPFFVEHQLDYAEVVMSEVILDNEDLARELFYALIEGEISFPEVAQQYIQDKSLRYSGGYLGTLRRTDLKPEISAAVFAAIPPQFLKPIVTSKGCHLILVEEVIQPQLNDALRYKILSDFFSNWLKQQIEQFEVEINLDLNQLDCHPEATHNHLQQSVSA